MNKWIKEAKSWGVPTFPIHIEWNEFSEGEAKVKGAKGKWEKRPLTKRGHLDAAFPPDPAQPWRTANGYGITTGGKLYVLDVDSYKGSTLEGIKKWIDDWGVPKETRQHKTTSGGWHLFFKLPKGWGELPSRAGIVKGLDSRGHGGWVAFGERYKVIRDCQPAPLPVSVCEEILSKASGSVRQVDLIDYEEPSPAEQAVIWTKLKQILHAEQLIYHRWNGVRAALGERARSNSSMDFSMAHKLGMVGFTEKEIVWLLLTQFAHGQCRWMSDKRVAHLS